VRDFPNQFRGVSSMFEFNESDSQGRFLSQKMLHDIKGDAWTSKVLVHELELIAQVQPNYDPSIFNTIYKNLENISKLIDGR
jgi:hypothetical protein